MSPGVSIATHRRGNRVNNATTDETRSLPRVRDVFMMTLWPDGGGSLVCIRFLRVQVMMIISNDDAHCDGPGLTAADH